MLAFASMKIIVFPAESQQWRGAFQQAGDTFVGSTPRSMRTYCVRTDISFGNNVNLLKEL